MLYMIVSHHPADYSFVTRKYGMLRLAEAMDKMHLLNKRMYELHAQARFTLTPVLDI